MCLWPLKLDEANVDHIIPVSDGGTNHKSNLQLVHVRCNHMKAAHLTDREGMEYGKPRKIRLGEFIRLKV